MSMHGARREEGRERRRRAWEAQVDHRLARLERAMYVMIGVGVATSGTAIWNVFMNLAQGGP